MSVVPSDAIRVDKYSNGNNYIYYDSSYQNSLNGLVYIPSIYENDTGIYLIEGVGNSALKNFKLITEVTIQNGIRSIVNYAFEGCTSLIYIQIPNSVNEIHNGALKTGNTNTKVVFTEGDNNITFHWSLHSIKYYYLRTTKPIFIGLVGTQMGYPTIYVVNNEIADSIKNAWTSGNQLSSYATIIVLPSRTPGITQTPQMTPIPTECKPGPTCEKHSSSVKLLLLTQILLISL